MPSAGSVLDAMVRCSNSGCIGCPYAVHKNCYRFLIHDGLLLLRRSVNHVLSVDEIRTSDFVYIEYSRKLIADNFVEPCGVDYRSTDKAVVLLLKDGFSYDFSETFYVKDYNVTWRCWRCNPTEEEQMLTPWKSPQ